MSELRRRRCRPSQSTAKRPRTNGANYCQGREVAFDQAVVNRLIETELLPRGVALQGCQPRDLIEHALTLAQYLDRARELTLDLLSAACNSYFVDNNVRTGRMTKAA